MFGGFTFGGFDGFPGDFGRCPGFDERPPANNSRYYELLGVHSGATQAEIKKAYQKLALRLHPDKGGDPERFKEINEAYDVLKDPNKRETYDAVGEDGLKEGMPHTSCRSGGDVFDLFEEMLGGSRGFRQHSRQRKARDMVHHLEVTLEEMYNGATKTLPMRSKRKCPDCGGSGSSMGKKPTCQVCNGDGIQVFVHRMGPKIVRIQGPCNNCGGSGVHLHPAMACSPCGGSGTVETQKVLEFCIEQGMQNGSKIVMRGEVGSSDPELEPGDLVVIVHAKEHRTFQRHNADLVMQKRVDLVDALCGINVMIEHLDGRMLRLTSNPGEVVQPGQWKCVEGEGMPVHGRPLLRGNLYIKFDVIFPKHVSPSQQSLWRSVLKKGNTNGQLHDSNVEVTESVPTRDVDDVKQELKSRAQFGKDMGNAMDSDEEDGAFHRHGIQCAQQ